MNPEHEFHGPNLAYMLGLQERYRTQPESLDPATREYFAGLENNNPRWTKAEKEIYFFPGMVHWYKCCSMSFGMREGADELLFVG